MRVKNEYIAIALRAVIAVWLIFVMFDLTIATEASSAWIPFGLFMLGVPVIHMAWIRDIRLDWFSQICFGIALVWALFVLYAATTWAVGELLVGGSGLLQATLIYLLPNIVGALVAAAVVAYLIVCIFRKYSCIAAAAISLPTVFFHLTFLFDGSGSSIPVTLSIFTAFVPFLALVGTAHLFFIWMGKSTRAV